MMNGMDLQQLRSFASVARHRHFTRAAAELHIGQPAVSQHVRRLEAELGVRLLSRTTRSVELTEAGRLLLDRVERALAELDAGLDELAELRGLVRGRLTIGAMQWLEPYDLAAALATFHALHPAIDIRVVEEVAQSMLGGGARRPARPRVRADRGGSAARAQRRAAVRGRARARGRPRPSPRRPLLRAHGGAARGAVRVPARGHRAAPRRRARARATPASSRTRASRRTSSRACSRSSRAGSASRRSPAPWPRPRPTRSWP